MATEPQKLWIVGKVLIVDEKEIGWMLEGICAEEEEAKSMAKEDEFIARVTLGQRFPIEAKDAEIMYWPHDETWEESTLYRMRNSSHVQA